MAGLGDGWRGRGLICTGRFEEPRGLPLDIGGIESGGYTVDSEKPQGFGESGHRWAYDFSVVIGPAWKPSLRTSEVGEAGVRWRFALRSSLRILT